MSKSLSRVEIRRWLAIKRNFMWFGTVVIGVFGFLGTVALVEPVIGAGWEFWAMVFPLYLLGGYGWALVMWFFWYLPLTQVPRDR